VACDKEAVAMYLLDPTSRHAQWDHYRAIANELRLIVLRMKHAEAAQELRRLAVSYERLAQHADGVSYPANED